MASVMVMGEEAHEALTAAEQLRAAAPRMLAVASVILGNPHDAEDAAGRDAGCLEALRDEAFARLSRQQRAVVVLHYQYGYTLDECSVLMRCRPGSARQHLARALRRLRESWND